MPIKRAEPGVGNDGASGVPALDLEASYVQLKPEIDAAVARVLASGRYVGGPEVEGFEREFAAFCGAAHGIGVGSGTDALRFALLAAGAGGPDAEVVTSPFSFVATAETATQVGARPVFVDIDPRTFTLDPAQLEDAVTPRTKAILPVHLYGHPAEMTPIVEIARRRRIPVIEDACQAHGALHESARAGSIGDAGSFSFYPTKNLGAFGEGGIVTTSNGKIAAHIRRLRDHGQVDKYRHVEEGYNGRLDAIQAAFLRVKLKRLDAWNARRRAIAKRYVAALEGMNLTLPVEMPWARHVYHQFAVRVADRDAMQEKLRRCGIATGNHYPLPLHLQPCYSWMGLKEGSFPHAEKAAREVLTLPLFPEMTGAQVETVCNALSGAVGRR